MADDSNRYHRRSRRCRIYPHQSHGESNEFEPDAHAMMTADGPCDGRDDLVGLSFLFVVELKAVDLFVAATSNHWSSDDSTTPVFDRSF